jgi:predicted acyl esterase
MWFAQSLFCANGKLSNEPPAATTASQFDEYVQTRHIRFRIDRVRLNQPTIRENWAARVGQQWLLEDQRFVEGRPDVLTWETEPLQNDTAIAGDIVAHLFASTS